jgi:hypothetical protein
MPYIIGRLFNLIDTIENTVMAYNIFNQYHTDFKIIGQIYLYFLHLSLLGESILLFKKNFVGENNLFPIFK